MKRTVSILAVVLAAATLAIGCSDDSGDLSKEEYLEKANAICKENRERRDREAAEIDGTDPAALSEFITSVASDGLEELEDLRALGYPGGDKDDLEAAYEIYEARYRAWEKEPTSATGSARDIELIEATDTLKAYGLTECGPTEGE